MKVDLDIHGVSIQVTSALSTVIADLRHDFSYFLSKDEIKPDLNIEVANLSECRGISWIPFFHFRKSTLYFSPLGERRVNFLGQAKVRYAPEKGIAKIYAVAGPRAYEALYSIVLSFVGERLSLTGFQRIHGLGIKVADSAAICLAPSGGGKSTLLLSLLKLPEVKVYSDDTPILDSHGTMLPFPQRIALANAPDVPQEFIRKFPRAHHQEKFVVGSEYFRDQIGEPVKPDRLILLKKSEAGPTWTPVSRTKMIGPLLRWLVLGHETPQVWEFFIRFSYLDIKRKVQMLSLRIKTLRDLIGTTTASEFAMGEDSMANARFLQAQMTVPA